MMDAATFLLVFMMAAAVLAMIPVTLNIWREYRQVKPCFRKLYLFAVRENAPEGFIEAIIEANNWDELLSYPKAEQWMNWVALWRFGLADYSGGVAPEDYLFPTVRAEFEE